MKVFCHNFNPLSNSGPNKFTRQLMKNLSQKDKIVIDNNQHNADLEFALIHMLREKKKPLILRLDGIYFNSSQDFKEQNRPIKYAYRNSDCVIFQSNFNKSLSEHWFGKHENSRVIHNGADVLLINSIESSLWDQSVDKNTKVWSCASSWRPHKRLEDNLRYFCEFSEKDTVMIVAGKDADYSTIKKYNKVSNNRILYAGDLQYKALLSLYKRSEKFIHLAYLDHCPNVVVDAQASGCEIVCSSTGGTKEIVYSGRVILEKDWNFEPIQLYNPPAMDFSNYYDVKKSEPLHSIEDAAKMYFDEMSNIIV